MPFTMNIVKGIFIGCLFFIFSVELQENLREIL
jgi:hypothetical protein